MANLFRTGADIQNNWAAVLDRALNNDRPHYFIFYTYTLYFILDRALNNDRPHYSSYTLDAMLQRDATTARPQQ